MGADTGKIKAPINAQYGELDTRITDGWPAFDAALTQAHVPHEGHIYKRVKVTGAAAWWVWGASLPGHPVT